MRCPPVRPGCATRRGKYKNLANMVEEYIARKRPECMVRRFAASEM
jgi:hypothetical protein